MPRHLESAHHISLHLLMAEVNLLMIISVGQR